MAQEKGHHSRTKGIISVALVVLILVLGAAPQLLTGAAAGAVIPQRHTTSTSSTSSTSTTTTSTTTTSSSSTFVKTYANLVGKSQVDVTPEDVQPTADGGYIFLGQSPTSTGFSVSWLVKTDSSGNAQWEKEVGCFTGAPGDYSLGVSVQQTTDGSYVIAGGAVGCGSATTCPSGTIQCSIVEKLDSAGNVVWAYDYIGSSGGSYLNEIRQTSDGGYIAVGGTSANGGENGALILKLSSSGSVQWQEALGPVGSTLEAFNAVAQTSDGGYLAVGDTYSWSGSAIQSVLVVKLASSGSIQWEKSYNYGSADSVAKSLVLTSDGGYLIAGSTSAGVPTGYTGVSYLLLKLDSSGNIQWQQAYNGGVYCGYSCRVLGGVIYSAHQTSDGGYILAGEGVIPGANSPGFGDLEPWAAKVDSSGNLLWAHLYYQVYKPTGLPLSEYFAASTLTSAGGLVAVGYTENYANGLGLLFVVKTDSGGLCGATCGDVYTASSLTAVNPGLTVSSPSLPISTTVTAYVSSPSTDQTTSVTVTRDC